MKIAFRPLARSDLQEIGDLIARDSPANASAFVRRLRLKVARLADLPERGRVRPEFGANVRSISFEGRVTIPYLVEDQTIVILRVLYAGRDFEA